MLGRAYFRYFCQVLFSELYLLIPVWEAAMFRTIHLPVLSIVSTGWLAVFLRWIYFALVRVWCGGLHTFFFFGVLQGISSVEVEKASAMPAGVGKWKGLQ